MFHSPNVLPLPVFLHNRLDRAARELISGADHPIDFSLPAGEPALLAPDSVSWRVFKNQPALFVGGVAAVLLELAEPRVRDGVWQNSSFRSAPLKRLQRTGIAAMVTVYGARSQAESMIAGVVRMHERVKGRTTEGEPYEASDPLLLDWVQATASYGFLMAYHTYATALSQEERDRFYVEARATAPLYGATGAPASEAELEALFQRMEARLAPSPVVEEFLSIITSVDALPPLVRPLQPFFVKAAVELLPRWVRRRLKLGSRWDLLRAEAAMVRMMVRLADRILLKSSPPVRACHRLGLPDDYLYRRR